MEHGGYQMGAELDRNQNQNFTYTANSAQPTQKDWEAVFGPAARDIKFDTQRNKRHSRWHLPDALKGSNPFLADRIDGLITDTTSSPFTTLILPYKYIENVDQKIKWNAWSFDSGLASRVPYESAARTLTQTKKSYSGYTVRQGLAITMEHNFMMSEKGRENFRNQLQQVVGSIQFSNDIDCQIALATAPSYAKELGEKYYAENKTNSQIIRDHIDSFGFLNKQQNGMDILIEDTRALLDGWGGKQPDFCLMNPKLTFQMTMMPSATEYITHGVDGQRKLAKGPNVNTYRGLRIIKTRPFSLEDGALPRDLFRRRVRTGEYYAAMMEPDDRHVYLELYDESTDQMGTIDISCCYRKFRASIQGGAVGRMWDNANAVQVLVFRPAIEHYMLGCVMAKGGLDDLGATLWGQTELSVYDDQMYGVWGCSYKYNERAMVFNNRNLVRHWDICYDGYVGGKDTTHMCTEEEMIENNANIQDIYAPYRGKSCYIIFIPVMKDPADEGLACYQETEGYFFMSKNPNNENVNLGAEQADMLRDVPTLEQKIRAALDTNRNIDERMKVQLIDYYMTILPDIGSLHNMKQAGLAANDNETNQNGMVFPGTCRWLKNGLCFKDIKGSGHHGIDYPGVASVRSGKGVRNVAAGIGGTMTLPKEMPVLVNAMRQVPNQPVQRPDN